MPKLRKRRKGRAVIPKKKGNAKAEVNTEEKTDTFDASDSDDSVPLSKLSSNTSQMCDTKDTSDTIDSSDTITPKLSGIISGNTSEMHDTKNTSETIDPNLSGANNVSNTTDSPSHSTTKTKSTSQMLDSKATNDAVTKENSTETIKPKQIEEPRVSQSTDIDKDTTDSYFPMQIAALSPSTETIPMVNPSEDMPEVSDPPSSDSVRDNDTVTNISKHPQIVDAIINPTLNCHDDFKPVSDTHCTKHESYMPNKTAIAQTEKEESYFKEQSDLAQIGAMTAKNEEKESSLTEKSDLAQIKVKAKNEASDYEIHLNNPSLTERNMAPSDDNTTINDPTNSTDTTNSDDTVEVDIHSNTEINMTPSIDDNLKINDPKNTTETTKIYTMQFDVHLNTEMKIIPSIDNVNISDLTNSTDTTKIDDTVRGDVDLNTEINVTPSADDNVIIIDPKNTTDITKSAVTVQVEVDSNIEINVTPSIDDNLKISDPKNTTDTTKSDDMLVDVDLNPETNMTCFVANVKICGRTNNTDTTKSDVNVQVEVDSNTEIDITPSIDNNLKISEPKNITDTTKSDDTMPVDVDLNAETNLTCFAADVKIGDPTNSNNTMQANVDLGTENNVTPFIANVKYSDPINNTDTTKCDDTIQVDVDFNTDINMTPSIDNIQISVRTTLADPTKSDETVKMDVNFNKRDDTTINSGAKIIEPSENETTRIENVPKSDNAVQSVIPSLKYSAALKIGHLLMIIDRQKSTDITMQETTNVAKIKEKSQASCDVIEIDSEHHAKDPEVAEIPEMADPGAEEHQKSLINRKQRKWLLFQERLKQKYGNKNEPSEKNFHYSNSEILNTPKKSEIESKSNTAGKNVIDPATGLQKYLQLMNLLNKNPEKCKKWLENQENQKQKLGDKYKEPTIYSTVKQIALGQANAGDDKSKPKVTNSLELLNVLYLNPDKCYSWLKKQEALKKQYGNMYQEPVIYPTVKLIALHHSKQENTKLSQATVPESKKKYEGSDNQLTLAQTPQIVPAENKKKAATPKFPPSSTPSVSSQITPADTKKTPTPKITPYQSTLSLAPKITPAGKKKITPENPTPPTTQKISSTTTTKASSQNFAAEVQNVDAKIMQEAKKNYYDKPITNPIKVNQGKSKDINNSSGEKGDLVYILFAPNTKYCDVHKLIHKQKQIRAILGSQYKIPKYNYDGSKSYITDTSKWVVRIPYPKKIRSLKYKMDLPEKYALDWVETQIHLIEKLGNTYQPEEYNPVQSTNQPSEPEISFQMDPFLQEQQNTYPSEQLAPQGQVNPYIAPAEHFYQQPSGYYEQNYYPPAADYYGSGLPASGYYDPGVMNPSTNYQYPPPYFGSPVPNPGQPNPSGFGQPMPYADASFGVPGLHDIAPPGIYPHATYPSLPGAGPPKQSPYTYPAMETVAPAEVVENKPLEFYSDIPLPSADAINASMNTGNTSTITTAATIQKSDNMKKDSNETTQAVHSSPATTPPLKTTQKVSVFSMDHCSGNVAFRFKGNDIYYPSHIKDKKKRKVWAEQQLVIYIKKGEQYTPPEFDNKGKLIPQKIELPSSIDSKSPPKPSDPKDAEILTSQIEDPAVMKVMETMMGKEKKFSPVFDKFGMRINPKYAPIDKPKERSSRDNKSGKRKEIERQREKSAEKESKAMERYNRRETSKEVEPPRKIQKTSKPEKPKLSLEEVFTNKTFPIEHPSEKTKIEVKLKKDDAPKETKTKPKAAAVPAKPASADSIISPSIRLAHQLPRQLTGVPRAMASTWFDPSESTDNKKVQSAPASKPVVAVLNIPVPAPLPPSTVTPAPIRKRAHTPTVLRPKEFTPPVPPTKVEEPDKSSGKSKTSAFERLGPPTEAKKPKLTINLMFVKDEKVEVVREVVEEHVPVYLRKDVIMSEDTIVKQYLKIWPWTRSVPVMRECSYTSRDIVLDEIEMSTYYASKSAWIKIVVTGYPPNFKKEEVLDILLDFVRPREFIPCFIEFKQKECVFLLNRSEDALSHLHSNGLIVKNDNVKLSLTICQTNLTLDSLRFYKGAVFKMKLNNSYDEEKNSLDLSAFQLQSDNSHFMYFPLNVTHNQIFIMNVVKAILPWRSITTLNLSGNRLTSINAFNLSEYLPSLRILDLSNNFLPTVSTLACFKGVPMYSLALDGNPLCNNFIQRDHYIDVVKLIFPRLIVLDGVSVDSKVEIKKNFSVSTDAIELVNSFLEIFFTLIDSNDRMQMEALYSENAVFSITCRPEMKRNPVYHNLKEFYMWCRSLSDRINPLDPLEGTIVGGPKIARYFTKWPVVAHDPHSFTVDVMHHTETSTLLKVTGLFKIPAETLTQDEPIIEFSRTFVLVTEDGIEYKVTNDMMYVSDSTPERAGTAFQSVGIQQRNIDSLSLRFDSPPDEDLKEKLTEILMRLTSMKLTPSRRCLDMVNWNLNKALAYFIRLAKLGSLGTLDF